MINITPAANPKRNLISFTILRVLDLVGEDLSMIACQIKPIPAKRKIVQVMIKRISVPGVTFIRPFHPVFFFVPERLSGSVQC